MNIFPNIHTIASLVNLFHCMIILESLSFQTGITGGGTAIQTRQYFTDLHMFRDKLTIITDYYTDSSLQ